MIYLMIELCNLFKVTEWLTLFYDLGNKADVVQDTIILRITEQTSKERTFLGFGNVKSTSVIDNLVSLSG